MSRSAGESVSPVGGTPARRLDDGLVGLLGDDESSSSVKCGNLGNGLSF